MSIIEVVPCFRCISMLVVAHILETQGGDRVITHTKIKNQSLYLDNSQYKPSEREVLNDMLGVAELQTDFGLGMKLIMWDFRIVFGSPRLASQVVSRFYGIQIKHMWKSLPTPPNRSMQSLGYKINESGYFHLHM